MAPPFRADHIGSLLRPQSLLDARSGLSSPSRMYSLEVPRAVREAEARAVAEVVRLQAEKGVRSVTDGEYGRHIYYGGFFEKLLGFEARPDLPIPDAFRTDFPTTTGLARMGATTRAAVVSTGRIAYGESPYLGEWLRLRDSLAEEEEEQGEGAGGPRRRRPTWREAKFTIPAPSYQHIQLRPGTAWTAGSGYGSDGEYFGDLAACYAAEVRTLYGAGLRNLQVDDPHLTYFCSAQFLGGCRRDGTDPDALLDLYLGAHRRLLAGRPADLHAGVHLCRGNMAGSTHWVSGSYERIARRLFAETDYQTYYLEFDDLERDGGLEPLRFLPRGKNVVLGLVSSKSPALEDKALVKEKIAAAAAVIAAAQRVGLPEALDCLAVSPQCGFSSSSLAGGKGMTMDIMWQKLKLVQEIAEEVWG